MQGLRISRRSAAALLLVIIGALAGGAGTGHTAPGITFQFEPLIGTSSINEIPKVSYGRGIGFHLFVQNTGTNSTPQTSSVVVTSDSATFDTAAAMFNGATVTCAANPSDNKQMVCPLPTGTLTPGDTFEAFFRFIAPTSTDIKQVSTTASLSVAAQTVGGKKQGNKGTSLASSTLKTDLVSDVTIDNAYLRGHETASTVEPLSSGHPQNFSLTTPSDLLNSAFGAAVGIQDHLGTPSDPCVAGLLSCTTLTIPAAKFAESAPGVPFPGNPFYDGTTSHPYGWTMSAQYPPGFQLHGIVHVDDNGVPQQVVSCASIVGGHPTPAYPLCWNHLTQLTNPKVLQADGEGLENGNTGWN